MLCLDERVTITAYDDSSRSCLSTHLEVTVVHPLPDQFDYHHHGFILRLDVDFDLHPRFSVAGYMEGWEEEREEVREVEGEEAGDRRRGEKLRYKIPSCLGQLQFTAHPDLPVGVSLCSQSGRIYGCMSNVSEPAGDVTLSNLI